MALSEYEILDGLADIINEETSVPLRSIRLDRSLRSDLRLDDAAMGTIFTIIAERFGVHVGNEQIVGFRTVGDVVSHLQAILR